MKENRIIVPIQLNQFASNPPDTDTTSCYFKINGAEAVFYHGVDKQLLPAVLAKISKDDHWFLECSKHIRSLPSGGDIDFINGRESSVGLMSVANLKMCQGRIENRNKPVTIVTHFLRLSESFKGYEQR